jgi:hypothetical protein
MKRHHVAVGQALRSMPDKIILCFFDIAVISSRKLFYIHDLGHVENVNYGLLHLFPE